MTRPADTEAGLRTSTSALRAPIGDEHALQSAGPAFDALADLMPQLVWSTLPDGSHDYYNAKWYEFTGLPEGSTDGEGWAEAFHPDDQPRAWEKWRHSLATGEPYEVEYRLRHHSGKYRWVLGRALPIRDENGTIQRWMGTCTDIEEQKRVALQTEILSQELSHRIKNIFAIISSLISLTARGDRSFAAPAKELLARISALSRAHEFVRPHTDRSRPRVTKVTLSNLLKTIFDAYPAFSEGRIMVEGPDTGIGARAATPIALVFHELVTNSVKYGALANDTGHISLSVAEQGDDVSITWRERGGKALAGTPQPGFGSKLIDMAISQQLGATYEKRLENDGLELRIEIPKDRLND